MKIGIASHIIIAHCQNVLCLCRAVCMIDSTIKPQIKLVNHNIHSCMHVYTAPLYNYAGVLMQKFYPMCGEMAK